MSLKAIRREQYETKVKKSRNLEMHLVNTKNAGPMRDRRERRPLELKKAWRKEE